MNAITSLKILQPMSASEAEAHVNELYKKMHERWKQRVNKHPIIEDLQGGKLPVEVIRIFFQNWYTFAIEVNTLFAGTYHKHLAFFKRHPNLQAPIGLKIADEFIQPKPPGHVLVLTETARALGLDEEELLYYPMLPQARGLLDFMARIYNEGSMAEWWATVAWEEAFGVYANIWFKALTEKYGLTRKQAVYFDLHHEADLKTHEEEYPAHGEFNRMILQTIFEDGLIDERPGYGVEYCILMPVELNAQFLEGCQRHYLETQSVRG